MLKEVNILENLSEIGISVLLFVYVLIIFVKQINII